MAITPSARPLLQAKHPGGAWKLLSKEELTWHKCSRADEKEGTLWKVGVRVGGGGSEGRCANLSPAPPPAAQAAAEGQLHGGAGGGSPQAAPRLPLHRPAAVHQAQEAEWRVSDHTALAPLGGEGLWGHVIDCTCRENLGVFFFQREPEEDSRSGQVLSVSYVLFPPGCDARLRDQGQH